MRYLNIAIAAYVLMLAGSASAADWTTTDGGSVVCSSLKKDGICWLTDIAADSSTISVRLCKTLTITVYGTGADIMPQTCLDSACAVAADREDLLSTALTGDSPNMFMTSGASPWELIRIDWTAGADPPTVSIKCGG